MAVEFVRKTEDCWEVQSKWHPRTAFVMIFVLLVVCALAIFSMVAPWGRPMDPEVWKALGMMIGMDALVTALGKWGDSGFAVRWDNEAIFLREVTGWQLGPLTSKFARIPYGSIQSVERRGIPRGVPPAFNLIEIVLFKSERIRKKHFIIDPNYFNTSSLIVFFEDLRVKAVQVNDGSGSDQMDRVLQMLRRRVRSA